ncbi:RNA polymerase sigma factor [Marinicrinis sediminis]|uniref:RNA polymerase sigma factor n=1 Tax=Marinicrinis sediminis TaxID=1652465 RepID=A0ABW5R8W1_9BACL
MEYSSIEPMKEPTFLEEVYRDMMTVAYARMRNKADALDVVQESWIKILQHLDSLDHKEKFIQWAKSIVNKTALNMIKRKSMEEGKYRLIADQSHGGEMTIEEHLAGYDVREQLKELDKDLRMMMEYKYMYGYKDQEIADRMGIPLGTVKIRLFRCREKLKKKLTDQNC